MSISVSPANEFADRIKLPLTFDVARLQADTSALEQSDFEYYSVLPLRSPAHLVDSSVAPPPPAEDYADGSWTPWLDTPLLHASPYLMSVVDTFREQSEVTLVRLLRMAPGAVVTEHTDPTLGLHIERSVVRLTIPVFSDDTVEFYLNNELVPMRPGECWYLRLSDPHRIVNRGDRQRINMTIDVVPNSWLRSLCAGFQR